MTRFDLEELVAAIGRRAAPVVLRDPSRLELPSKPTPFVSPKLVSRDDGSVESATNAEVVLVSSPAAVGKTTAARYLSSESGMPLLNLAKVPVSTDALVGLLTMNLEQPTDALGAIHRGELTVVVDALDEGRLQSGDANFVQFLSTMWELLLRDRSETARPKVVLLGRDVAAELVETSLLYAEQLTVSRLTLDFFEEADAVEVIETHAASTAHGAGMSWSASAVSRDVIDAFFVAIASALRIEPDDLWTDPHGRAFGGYAPVLGAIGTLLAREENPIRLLNALRTTGAAERAWDVIENVADTILEREQRDKLVPQLEHELGHEAPAEAYDRIEQLTYLSQLAHGQPIQVTDRVGLRGKEQEHYRRMVAQHLPDHPFVQGGRLANDVLASVVLAHSIDADLISEGDPQLVRLASRQPFLWRSYQRLSGNPPRPTDGRYVGYVLNSLWTDSLAEAVQVIARPDQVLNATEFEVSEPDSSWSFVAMNPIEFYEQLRNCTISLAADATWQGHQGQQDVATFDLRGQVDFSTHGALEIRAASIHLDGNVRLSAAELNQPPNLRLTEGPKFAAWWGDGFATKHPWNTVVPQLDAPEESDPTTKLESLLRRLAASAHPGAPITLQAGYLPTEDKRNSWIERDFGTRAFSQLIELMVGSGLARAEPAGASGPHPKVKVHFEVAWEELLAAIRRPERAEAPVSEVASEAVELFRHT